MAGGIDTKREPKMVDEGEMRTTFKPQPPPYTGYEKKLPKSYSMQEVVMRKALKQYGPGIGGDIYKEWKEFQGYFSNQFSEDFPLQVKLKERATELYLSTEDLGEDESGLLNYNLKPLDIEMDIMDDFTCLIIGRRRSGKSFWMRYALYHLRHRFPCGVVITGTALNNFWGAMVPKNFIHHVSKINEVIENVFKRQEFFLKYADLGLDPRFFLILDDVLQDVYLIRYSQALSRIFTDGRHYKLFIMVATQDPRGLPPMLRENTDLCVCFRQFQKGRLEAIRHDFLDFIDDQHVQVKFHRKHTSKIDKETGEPFDFRKWIHEIEFLKVAIARSKERARTTDEADQEWNDEMLKRVAAVVNEGIPQALCTIQGDTTDNLLDIFKVTVAEKPPEYRLGDARYWSAAQEGRWKGLTKTWDEVSFYFTTRHCTL